MKPFNKAAFVLLFSVCSMQPNENRIIKAEKTDTAKVEKCIPLSEPRISVSVAQVEVNL